MSDSEHGSGALRILAQIIAQEVLASRSSDPSHEALSQDLSSQSIQSTREGQASMEVANHGVVCVQSVLGEEQRANGQAEHAAAAGRAKRGH